MTIPKPVAKILCLLVAPPWKGQKKKNSRKKCKGIYWLTAPFCQPIKLCKINNHYTPQQKVNTAGKWQYDNL